MQQNKQLRLNVSGKVQGVFYRAHIRQTATELGLLGFARNEEDGTVTVLVQGPEGALMTLLKASQKGSPACQVESIEQKLGPIEEPFKDFKTY